MQQRLNQTILMRNVKERKGVMLFKSIRPIPSIDREGNSNELITARKRFVIIMILRRKLKEKHGLCNKLDAVKRKLAMLKLKKEGLDDQKTIRERLVAKNNKKKELKGIKNQLEDTTEHLEVYKSILDLIGKKVSEIRESKRQKQYKRKSVHTFLKNESLVREELLRSSSIGKRLSHFGRYVAESRENEGLPKINITNTILPVLTNLSSLQTMNSKRKRNGLLGMSSFRNHQQSGVNGFKQSQLPLRVSILVNQEIQRSTSNFQLQGSVIIEEQVSNTNRLQIPGTQLKRLKSGNSAYNVSFMSESEETRFETFSRNSSNRSLLSSIKRGVDEMKAHIQVPMLSRRYKSQRLLITKLEIGQCVSKPDTFIKKEELMRNHYIKRIIFYTEAESIKGLIIETQHGKSSSSRKSNIHGIIAKSKRIFELKGKDTIRSIYYYCQRDRLTSLRFVTANQKIFTIGVCFDEIDDLENIHCFDLIKNTTIKSIESHFNTDKAIINSISLGFDYN